MTEFVFFSLPTLVYLLVRRRDPDARATIGLRLPRASDWLLGLLALAISLGIGWAATLAIPPEILRGPGTAGRVTGLVGAVAVALRALGEEVFFRGFLQGWVAKRWGGVAGIVVQGVAFLLPHLMLLTLGTVMIPLVAGQFVIGLVMGWLRHHTGSIGPSSLAHIVTNLVVALAP